MNEMSRYACRLYQNGVLIDDNGIAGYDEGMQTYFFHSGEENTDGAPLIWLGVRYQEWTTIDAMIFKLKSDGYDLEFDEETDFATMAK
jgi:phage-related protein